MTECQRDSVTSAALFEGRCPGPDDVLIVDCTVHGEIGRVPVGMDETGDEYTKIEMLFAQHKEEAR